VTAALLILTALAAVADWIAVARDLHRAELALKPLTLVLLIAVVASANLGDAKPWVIAALVLGLIGDVALMFSAEQTADPAFIAGLSAFLLGHIAYMVAFLRHGVYGLQLAGGVLIVGGVSALVLPKLIPGVRAAGGTKLLGPVCGYIGALGLMTALAVGTGSAGTAAGGLFFLASDATLAWQRFVKQLHHGPVIVIVTYHLAQVLIVVGLMQ
jgi:uncharacterized membrane protein YhhN